MNDSNRGKDLLNLSNDPAGYRVLLALMRSPVPLTAGLMTAVGDVWMDGRRSLDPLGAMKIDQEKAAAEWAVKQMTEWGLQNAHLEHWDFGHVGWLNERLTAMIVSPVKDVLTCEVLSWTPSTRGTVTARPCSIGASPEFRSDRPLKPVVAQRSVAEITATCIVAVDSPPRPSVSVNLNSSCPVKPGCGKYMNVPSSLAVAVPYFGGENDFTASLSFSTS